jgi:hypothetical protein
MLPNKSPAHPYRVGGSRDISSLAYQLQEKLNAPRFAGDVADRYRVRVDPVDLGDYRRLVVEGENFRGSRALVFDVRFGAGTATADPAIMVRTRGPVAESAEIAIGAKVVPVGSGGAGERDYKLTKPVDALRDIVFGTFMSVKESYSPDDFSRPLSSEMLSIMIGESSVARWQRARERYLIPTGYQFLYGDPSPGEQIQQASTVQWYLGSGRVDDEYDVIRRQMLTEGVRGGRGMGALLAHGVYARERVSADVYNLKKTAETYSVRTSGDIERQMALVMRGGGGDQVESQLKHLKGRTTFNMERHEVYPFRKTHKPGPGGAMREVWEPVTPADYSKMSEEEAATFGEQLIEGRLSTYQTFSAIRPGEPTGRNVLVSAGYLATIPTHAGAMLVDQREWEQFEGVAWNKKADPIDIPFQTPADLDPDLVLMGGNKLRDFFKIREGVIGKHIPAGRRGFSLGSIQVPGRETIDLGLKQEQYTAQVQGITLVIPPYMTRSGEEFRLSKYDDQADVIPTTALARRLEEELGEAGIRVETSALAQQPYLSTSLMTEQGFTGKGAGSYKAGYTPSGGPEGMGMSIRPMGGPLEGRFIRIGAATQEAKQSAEAFGAAFAIQPDVNKISMLEMLDPRLAEFARKSIQKKGGTLQLDRLAKEYAKIMGVPYQEAPTFMYNALMDTFMNLTPEENEAARVRYGIYSVPGGAELGPFRVTKQLMDAWSTASLDLKRLHPEEITQDVTLMEGEKPGELLLGNTGIRFQAVPKRPNVVGPAGDVVQEWQEDVYDMFFYTEEQKGLLMPMTQTMALEHAGGGTDVNKDIVKAISRKFPQWAFQNNLLPEQGPDIEGITPQKKAWLGIFNAYNYNTSAIRGDILAIPEGQSDKWTTIGKTEAETLLATLDIFDETRDKMSEEEQMKVLKETFGWQGFFFSGSGRFLPSPEAIWGIDEIDLVKNVGESKAHYITSFLDSFKELLHGELRSDYNPALFTTHTTFMGGKESRIGKVLTGGKEVTKQVLGKQIPGAVTGHYGVLNFLEPGEAYVSKGELNRMAENMGVTSKSGKKLLWEHIQREGASGVFYRYPSLNEETAVMPIRFIGDDTIRQRAGFDMSSYSALAPGTLFLDPFTTEPVVGDEDWDPAGWRLGVAPIYDEQGEIIGFKDTLREDPGYRKWFSEEGLSYLGYQQLLRHSMGEGGASEYSTLTASLYEYYTGKSPLDTRKDVGLVKPETVMDSAQLQSWIDARRGTSHRALSAWSIAAAVTGIDPERMEMAMHGMPILYQETLESTRAAGRMSPIEMLMNTVMFQPSYRTGEMELAGATGKDMPTGDLIYSQPNLWTKGMGSKAFLKNVMKSMTKMKQLSAEALAAGLANPEDFEKNYGQILSALSSGPRDKWYQILTGQTGFADFFQGGAVSETGVLGTVLYGLATARSIRKAYETGDTEGTQTRNAKLRSMLEEKTIPFGGEMHSIQSLSENDQIKSFLTSYGILTHQELLPGQGAVPGVSEILDAVLGIPEGSRGAGAAAQMLGVANLLELQKAERVPGRVFGGGTIDTLKQNITEGTGLQFRASELATLAAGDPFIAKEIGRATSGASHEYVPQTKVRMMSKWMGNLFGVAGFKEAIEQQEYDPGTQYAIDLGNTYEELIAYFGPSRFTERSYGEGRRRVTAENLSLLPRDEMAPKNLAWRDPTTGKRVTGLPDVVGLQQDDGSEYLHIQELKFGSKRGAQGMIQAAIYREGLMHMYDQDSESLRGVLTSWVDRTREYYSALRYGGEMQGKMPAMVRDPDWVERAMAAIGRGDVRISSAHGGGNVGRIERKEPAEYNVSPEPDTLRDFKVSDLIQATQKNLISEFRDLSRQTMLLHTKGSLAWHGDWGDRVFKIKTGFIDWESMMGIGSTIRDPRLDDLLATQRYRRGGFIPGLSTTPDKGYNVGTTAILHPGEAIVNLTGFGPTRIASEDEMRHTGRTPHHLDPYSSTMQPDYVSPDEPDAADAADAPAAQAAAGAGGGGDEGIGGTNTTIAASQDPQGEGGGRRIPKTGSTTPPGSAMETAQLGYLSAQRLMSEEFGFLERIETGAAEVKAQLAEQGIEIEAGIPEGGTQSERLTGALAILRQAGRTRQGTALVAGMKPLLQAPAKMVSRIGKALPLLEGDTDLTDVQEATLAGLSEQYKEGVGVGAIPAMLEQAKAAEEARVPEGAPQTAREQQQAADSAGELSDSLTKLIERVDETRKVHAEYAGQLKDSGSRLESMTMNLADLQQTSKELKEEFGTITDYRAQRDAQGQITGLERQVGGRWQEVPRAEAAEQLRGAISATAAGREAEEQLAQIQQTTGGGRAARWVRGVFGGFGWMFLQRAAGMGLRGVTEGFEESEQAAAQRQEILMQELGETRLGAGRRFYERERAMIRKGGTGLGAYMYDLQSSMTGTMAGDLFTSAQTGFGLGLAGTYLASEMGLLERGFRMPRMLGGRQISGATVGKGIWGLAGAVGLAAMPLAMQASYLQNPEQTMAMRAGLRRRQLGTTGATSFLAGVEGGWYGAGQRISDMLGGDTRQVTIEDAIGMGLHPERPPLAGTMLGDILGQPLEWTQDQLQQLVPVTAGDIERDVRTQQLQRFLGDRTGGMSAREMGPAAAQTFGQLTATLTAQAGGTWWENVPQEVMSRAIGMYMGTGRVGEDDRLARRAAELIMGGVPLEEGAAAAFAGGRITPSAAGMGEFLERMPMDRWGAQRMIQGAQAMGQVSNVAAMQLGVPTTMGGVMSAAQTWQRWSQMPEWDMFRRGGEIAGQVWETGGLTRPDTPTPDQLAERGRFGRYQTTQSQLWAQQQDQRRRGIMASGYGIQAADAFERAWESVRFDPRGQAWLGQAQPLVEAGVMYGASPAAQAGIMTGIGQMGAQGQYGNIAIATRAMQGDPGAIARMNMRDRPNYVTAAQWREQAMMSGGRRLPVDITGAGEVTGMGLFQSYISPTEAGGMFGAGWEGRPVAAATQAGGIDIGGRNFVGQWAIRAQAAQTGYEHQMSSLGIAAQQVALTRQYYLGGGMMGRGLFAIQDDQRALGYEQTEWQFDRQRAQLGMQGRQFRENQALQWQGMQMQRRFTQADWAFQDQTRALQWGWRQEDFQEQARFMTGRQRTLAERQMGRETIMHGMEEEDIERQRAQQKEAWGLEEQRFRLVNEHYKEQEMFQKEGIKRQEEFFERRKKLEEEMVDLQRTYMLEQLKLQEQSIGAQAEYAKLMHEHSLDMIALEQTQAQIVDDWEQAVTYTDLIGDIFNEVRQFIEDVTGMDLSVPSDDDNGDGPSGPPPDGHPDHRNNDDSDPKIRDYDNDDWRRQHGGTVYPNLAYLVGERGPEVLMPRSSPWASSYIPSGAAAQGGGMYGPQEITIYIGNEKLGTFVLDTISKELRVG